MFLAFTVALSAIMVLPGALKFFPLRLVLNCSFATLWVACDAHARGIVARRGYYLAMFFLWPVLFPAYAIRSRGVLGGFLLLLSVLFWSWGLGMLHLLTHPDSPLWSQF